MIGGVLCSLILGHNNCWQQFAVKLERGIKDHLNYTNLQRLQEHPAVSLEKIFSPNILHSWLYGDFGCQLYAAVGFYFGIGVIFSLGLIILDSYVLTFSKSLFCLIYIFTFCKLHNSPYLVQNWPICLDPRPRFLKKSEINASRNEMKYFGYFKYFKKVWFWIALSWHILLVFTLPPLMDIFGRCKHYISFLNNGPIKLIMVIIMAKNMIKIMITMIKIWTGACWHCMYHRLLAWQLQAIQNILSVS